MRIGGLSCCGVKEMQNIAPHRTPEAVLQAFCLNRFSQPDPNYGYDQTLTGNGRLRAAHFIFTQAGQGQGNHYGETLADYIREMRLGEVVKTSPKRNPNSRRMLVAFVWTPDVRRLKTWWKRHPIPVLTNTATRQVVADVIR